MFRTLLEEKMRYLIMSLLMVLTTVTVMGANKIAVVDMQRVIVEVKQGKKAMALLKAEKAKKEKAINAKKDTFLQQQKELENMMKNPAADKAKAKAKYESLARTYQMLQREAQKMQQELLAKEQQEARKIMNKVQAILKKVVKKEGFDIVLNKAAILYVPASDDITNQVIREYDKVNK